MGNRAGTDTPTKGSGAPLKKPDDAGTAGASSWELGPQAGTWMGSSAGRGKGWGSRGRGRTDTDTRSPRLSGGRTGPQPPMTPCLPRSTFPLVQAPPNPQPLTESTQGVQSSGHSCPQERVQRPGHSRPMSGNPSGWGSAQEWFQKSPRSLRLGRRCLHFRSSGPGLEPLRRDGGQPGIPQGA